MIGHITYLSKESMHTKFGRNLQDQKTFQVESYLHYQGLSFVERFDANTYLYLTKAMDYFDISEKYGSLTEAFKNVLSKILVVSFTSDWLFPTEQSKEIVNALMNLNKNVSFVELKSSYGHDAFLLENELFFDLISGFIAKV